MQSSKVEIKIKYWQKHFKILPSVARNFCTYKFEQFVCRVCIDFVHGSNNWFDVYGKSSYKSLQLCRSVCACMHVLLCMMRATDYRLFLVEIVATSISKEKALIIFLAKNEKENK